MKRAALGGALIFALALSCQAANYSMTILISTKAANPAQLQKDFIAATTTQFVSTVVKTIFGSDTYTITISSKAGLLPPPAPPPVGSTMTYTDCYVYGFAEGMEEERGQVLSNIDNDYEVNPSSESQSYVTESLLCYNDYRRIMDLIAARGYEVYTTTGGRVTP